ncbi:hypothetical protein JCM9279_006250 [Rhodotorula babjevae]
MPSPSPTRSPCPPPSLVLIPPTPLPPSSPRLPSSPAPLSFSRRGRTSQRIARVPPPPLPSMPPVLLGAAHVLEHYLSSPSPTALVPSPRTRTPPALALPFTSLLVIDSSTSSSETERVAAPPPSSTSSSKKHKKQRVRSRSTPARPRIPAIWREKTKAVDEKVESRRGAGGRSCEGEYLLVDAKLEWASRALGF